MRLDPPVSLPLARRPTPLERLDRAGARLGLDLWVKRDDLTGAALSGNKIRKLEHLAAQALEQRADTLITCGATTSNHARATALVAARLGLGCRLLLRGTPAEPATGNLLLDELVGARTTFIPPEAWPERAARMEALADEVRADGGRPYVIPEGGSNAVGAMGYAVAVGELLAQCDEAGLAPRRIVHATGSGGTTAGLALGVAAAGREEAIQVLGVAVCDDRAYFDGVIGRIADAAAETGYVPEDVRARTRWTILEGFQGAGYAKTTPEELAALRQLAREEGLLLDPVYTNKAFGAVAAHAGAWAADGPTLFLHTGGIFGLFDFAAELAATGEGS